MRNITEIKEAMTTAFMENEAAAGVYGFTPGQSFESLFSKVSIESIVFFICASAIWVLESLFGEHKKEVEGRIDEIMPHRPRWYSDKVRNFMKGMPLIPDTDRYDTSTMTADAIETARVVKHAVATENKDASILTIKVAGEKDGRRCPLDTETKMQIEAYISEIKDAGVRINVVNTEPDLFNCEVYVYYDPILLPENVEQACRDAIKNYVENLPFNGEYSNMGLVDELQNVEGVKVVEFASAETAESDTTLFVPINGLHIPKAGYFTVNEVKINMQAYE